MNEYEKRDVRCPSVPASDRSRVQKEGERAPSGAVRVRTHVRVGEGKPGSVRP